jgi:hypothetical protein
MHLAASRSLPVDIRKDYQQKVIEIAVSSRGKKKVVQFSLCYVMLCWVFGSRA